MKTIKIIFLILFIQLFISTSVNAIYDSAYIGELHFFENLIALILYSVFLLSMWFLLGFVEKSCTNFLITISVISYVLFAYYFVRLEYIMVILAILPVWIVIALQKSSDKTNAALKKHFDYEEYKINLNKMKKADLIKECRDKGIAVKDKQTKGLIVQDLLKISLSEMSDYEVYLFQLWEDLDMFSKETLIGSDKTDYVIDKLAGIDYKKRLELMTEESLNNYAEDKGVLLSDKAQIVNELLRKYFSPLPKEILVKHAEAEGIQLHELEIKYQVLNEILASTEVDNWKNHINYKKELYLMSDNDLVNCAKKSKLISQIALAKGKTKDYILEQFLKLSLDKMSRINLIEYAEHQGILIEEGDKRCSIVRDILEQDSFDEQVVEPESNSLNDDTKECPMCAETIKEEAKICRFCRHEF